MDVYIKPEPENAKRVIAALSDFGFGSVGLSENDFIETNQVVQFGVPPVRIGIITSISGVTWEEALRGSVLAGLDATPVRFIGKKQFIENKRAIGRKKDLADLEALGE